MKKITAFSIAFLCVAFTADAQISKGSTFLGGSLSVRTSSTKYETPPAMENNVTEWGVRPQLGKAVADNKIIGVFLNLTGFKQEYPTDPAQTETRKNENFSYGGGVFYRQYFPLGNGFNLFGEGNAMVALSNSKSSINELLTNERKATDLGLAIAPGISYAVTQKLQLELAMGNLISIGYSSSRQEDFTSAGTIQRSEKGNSFSALANANVFSQLSVGLRWMLPSKRS